MPKSFTVTVLSVFVIILIALIVQIVWLVPSLKKDPWYNYRYVQNRSCEELSDGQAYAYCKHWFRFFIFGYPEV